MTAPGRLRAVDHGGVERLLRTSLNTQLAGCMAYALDTCELAREIYELADERETYELMQQGISRCTVRIRDLQHYWYLDNWSARGDLDAIENTAWRLAYNVGRTHLALVRKRLNLYHDACDIYLALNKPEPTPRATVEATVVVDTLCVDCRKRQRVWVDADGLGYCKRCRRPPAGKV